MPEANPSSAEAASTPETDREIASPEARNAQTPAERIRALRDEIEHHVLSGTRVRLLIGKAFIHIRISDLGEVSH